jgi:pilus assembly protein Flp/PilA
MKRVIDFIRDETAATSIEYALIAAGIAIAIVTAVNSLGTTLGGKYGTVKAAFD